MDKYYVSGCVDNGSEIETCDDSEATFWTLYERKENGMSHALLDCVDRLSAEAAIAVYVERDVLQQRAEDPRVTACVNAFDGIPTDRIEGKDLGQILAGELRLHGAGPRADGGFGFEFSGGVCQLMAEAYADQFKQSGAINYLELLFDHTEIGPLTITMQRVEGLTPAQKLAQAEAERDALQEQIKTQAELLEGVPQDAIDGGWTAKGLSDYAKGIEQKTNGPSLQEHDFKALLRFHETSEDGQGYDIGAEKMARLVELGLASKGPHGIRNITWFGQWIVDRHNGEDISQPLKTEGDHKAD